MYKDDDEFNILSELDVSEYIRIFKNQKGTNLEIIIKGCLQFGNIVNAKETGKEISRKAQEALKILGKENTINALRVRNKYGIEIYPNSSTVKEIIDSKEEATVN